MHGDFFLRGDGMHGGNNGAESSQPCLTVMPATPVAQQARAATAQAFHRAEAEQLRRDEQQPRIIYALHALSLTPLTNAMLGFDANAAWFEEQARDQQAVCRHYAGQKAPVTQSPHAAAVGRTGGGWNRTRISR